MVKVKKILRIVSCVLSLMLVYAYLCFVFIPKDVSEWGGDKYYHAKGFIGEPDDSLDIIMFGHSGVYSGFSPVTLYKEYGYTSYASSTASQPIKKINDLLEKAVKRQKLKVVFLDVDCLYVRFPLIRYYDSLFAPFVFHARWKNLKPRDFYLAPGVRTQDVTKGYKFSAEISGYQPGEYMGKADAKPAAPKKVHLSGLNRFVKICRKNDIQIVFSEFANATSWSYARHNFIQQYADAHGIDFLDMNIPNDRYQADFARDFQDKANHYNVYGAEKATRYLGRYLTEKFGDKLTDRRTDEKYSYWKEAISDFDKKLEGAGVAGRA